MFLRAIRALFSSGLLLALIGFSPLPLFSQTGSSSALNPYGACAAPAQEGVHLCAPPAGLTVNAPFQVIGAATSGRGQVILMELWADGKKVSQSLGSPFDEPVTLEPGNHELTLVAVDETGATIKSVPSQVSVNLVDQQTCSPPDTPGVKVCAPTSACNTQPWVNFSAAGRAAEGDVKRMELWINGTKMANFPGDHFDTNMVIFDVNYTVTINAVDRRGNTISKSFVLDGPC